MIILNLVNILLFYSLLFKVVSLFLGVLISDMNFGTNGWGVMIGWTIWILALPFILELFDFFFVHGKGFRGIIILVFFEEKFSFINFQLNQTTIKQMLKRPIMKRNPQITR